MKHPQSKKAKDANAPLEALRFKQAKGSDSIAAYEAYLKHHPHASGAEAAQRRLRELRYADARQLRTVAAFQSFVACYSEGADADTLRAELPAIQVLENAWETASHNNTVNAYKDYLAKYPIGDHAEEAKARVQIHDFNSGFGIAAEFTEEQMRTYMERLENETYSTVIKEPLEYYIVTGGNRSTPTKSKVVVRPLTDQKACWLHLEAGNLSITAVYISASSHSPVTRPLFPSKWSPTMTHNGFAGPGLEIELDSPRREEFKNFLDTFSIYHRVMDSIGGGTLGYVIPDLVSGSDRNATPYPHFGSKFAIQHQNRPIVFKVDGVKGMPVATITSYKQALALKTYLKILGSH